MAVVTSVSKLLLGRVQGFSRVASSVKYASTSTGKYAERNCVIIAAWSMKLKTSS